MRPAAATRGIGVVLALVVVLVLGIPALLGWIPLPVTDDRSGVPAGTLVVVQPVDAAAPAETGDVVTVVTSSGALTTRAVQSTDAASLTLSAGGSTTTRVDRTHLRAVERYQLPLLGHVVGALPAAQRPWWARLLGLAFLAWAAAELWSFAKRRRATPTDDDQLALGAAPAPRAITSARTPARSTTSTEVATPSQALAAQAPETPAPAAAPAPVRTPTPATPTTPMRPVFPDAAAPVHVPPASRAGGARAAAARAYGRAGTGGAAAVDPAADPLLAPLSGTRQLDDLVSPVPAVDPALEHLPTRRERARARRSSPWSRMSDAAASAIGAVVMATRTFDRRHEDPAEASGKHRNRMPATSIDVHPEDVPRAETPPTRSASAPTTGALPTSATLPTPGAATTRSAGATTPPLDTATSPAAPHSTGVDETNLWAERAPKAEVERAALIQDFEARRAAAEATLLHGLPRGPQISPVDRLLGERETGRTTREPGAAAAETDGESR